MWPAALGSKNIVSYQQQYNALRSCLSELDISSQKVTHLWRVAGAQQMDSAGLADDARTLLHKWQYKASVQHCEIA